MINENEEAVEFFTIENSRDTRELSFEEKVSLLLEDEELIFRIKNVYFKRKSS